MTMFSAFSASYTGMRAQSSIMDTIGRNVANINSGGYKGTNPGFIAHVQGTVDNPPAYGGVQPYTTHRISDPGTLLASKSAHDVAISGDGFFVLNTERDGSGEQLFTRDGAFRIAKGPEQTVTEDDKGTADPSDDDVRTYDTGYLVDKNGYYVMGWEANADGSFPSSGSLTALRVDPFVSTDSGQQTQNAELILNLNGQETTSGTHDEIISVVDSDAAERDVFLTFTKTANDREWTVEATTSDSGDTVNSGPQTLTFAGDGSLSSGGTYALDITWADGATSQVSLDLSDSTQFNGVYNRVSYDRDGYAASDMSGFGFDERGYVTANFENETSRRLYRVPLATFSIPDRLEPTNGMVFRESPDSGSALIQPVGEGRNGTLLPSARELSNVDVEQEFTRMMVTQRAYSASSKVFSTVDEVLQTTRDLKS